MQRGQAKIVEGILAYERDWLLERDRFLKLHHALRIYGLSRHSQVIRCLALVMLKDGEEETKKWANDRKKEDSNSCYTRYEIRAAIELSRRLREAFKQ